MSVLNKQVRAISLAIKKIVSKPIEHLLNMVILSLLIIIITSILVINNTNMKWQKDNISYPQITVYLAESATAKDVAKLQISMSGFGRSIIKGFQYIEKNQAAKELQNDQSLKDIANQINLESNNNLPNILLINTNTSDTKKLELLKNKIAHLNFVSSIELDENYANKLGSLLQFIDNATYSLLLFFSICLILVLYNLIRLQMFQNKEEITVSRLIGASDLFIMRPLVYYTILQVTLSGIIAYFIIHTLINAVNGLANTAGLILGNNLQFIFLNKLQIIGLFIALVLFSIFAVFVAVLSVLKRYHPK